MRFSIKNIWSLPVIFFSLVTILFLVLGIYYTNNPERYCDGISMVPNQVALEMIEDRSRHVKILSICEGPNEVAVDYHFLAQGKDYENLLEQYTDSSSYIVCWVLTGVFLIITIVCLFGEEDRIE